jgi:hypothetical protein
MLFADAWCGNTAASGAYARHASAWALRKFLSIEQRLDGKTVGVDDIDLRDWRQPEVGWGVVLPDRNDLLNGERDTGADAPEPIRRLLKARGDAPVFRYRADIADDGRLQRYYGHGKSSSLHVAGDRGLADNAVPRYLLIVGSPQQIPWKFQYRLQCDAFVGRLDLDDEALARYVDALLNDWPGNVRHADKPVLWSVDHGHPDITYLMRKAIVEQMHEAFDKAGFEPHTLTEELALSDQLVAALEQHQPAFVLTASHGATFPLDDPGAMKSQLGLPVDVDHSLLNIDDLLKSWNPSGAIWYAHACCSAGADKPSSFQGLIAKDSSLGRMLAAVAECGPCTSPLPRALLGGERPLAAFVGHVEPTFDWTLRDPVTGQVMAKRMVLETFFRALHSKSRMPVAMAMDRYYDAVAGLLMSHLAAIDDNNYNKAGAKARAMQAKLAAIDRLSMVVLGDPTVCLAG